MEVGCRVETEDMHTRTRRYVTKAYLTFVAVDAERQAARQIPTARARRPTTTSAATREAETRRTERLRAAGRRGVGMTSVIVDRTAGGGCGSPAATACGSSRA